jgi:polyribonucleotide 5'-hydroxyl-kinase
MVTSDLPSPQGERHVLAAEEELRLEVGFQSKSICQILLLKGSCELYGVELALNKPYQFTDGGLKLALFTWHGCVLDVECETLEISYTSDETNCNIAFVNTHAQLEALRDEAAAGTKEGPRVLIVGPTESGKSALTKILTAYATKLGRSPIWIDLDPADNALSVPGTLAACPMDRQAVQIESFATTGIPPATAAPLVLWHGGTELSPDLFRAQVTALGQKVDQRLETDDHARSSGILVNTNGWIQDEGYLLLLHTVSALRINIVLVMGHDRLYSMMKNALKKQESIKVIKIPRSGGVVSRGKDFLRQHRSRAMRRYFYGDSVEASAQPSSTPTSSAPTPTLPSRVPQLTPFLAQIPFAQVKIYKFSSMSLSASLLPVAAAQATESVQVVSVSLKEAASSLQHKLLAVCHPQAEEAYQSSQSGKDLYAAGVAGFCVVERVLVDTEMLHLLSPCAGSLPSHTFLVGDLTWME